MRVDFVFHKLSKAFAVLLIVLLCELVPLNAYAVSPQYTAARNAFANGNLASAEKSLESILLPNPKISAKEWEDASKLLGVCYYLADKKLQAKRIFRALIQRNPTAQLEKQDLLDPTLQGFFDSIKSPVGSGKNANATPPKAQTGVKQTAMPKAITGVIVHTNVKRATVFDNGIFVGSSNKTITLDPGTHSLTVSSEGFQDANARVSLKIGELQTIKVKLNPPPAPKKAIVTGPLTPLSTNKQRTNGQGKSSLGYSSTLPGPKNGVSLADEFKRDSVVLTRPQPVYTQPQQPVYAQPQQPMYPQPQQPMYPQPQQPMYPQPQQPMYSQPQQPMYSQPQQPMYSQPQQQMYAQPKQPMYVQPQQPMYVQPQQPMYVQPQQPMYVQPQQPVYRPVPQQSRIQSSGHLGKSTYSSKKSALGKYPVLGIMPLGIGQFANNEPVKGCIFAASQIAFGALAYSSYSKEAAFTAKEAAAINTETTEDDFDPSAAKAYKNTQRTNQYMWLGATGVSWIISIIDAYTGKSSSQRANASVDSFDIDNSTAANAQVKNSPQIGVQLFSFQNGVGLNLSLHF
jgi:hypothetical protein